MSLPGGWIADRLIGQRRAVLYGGILIAARPLLARRAGTEHVLSGPGADRARHRPAQAQHQRDRRPAYTAQQDLRRDAAFSLFYMGINLGAFLGPFITGYLAQERASAHGSTGWG